MKNRAKKPSFLITILLIFLAGFLIFNLQDKTDISVDGKGYSIKMPYVIKFASLIERQHYYKFWTNEIITPNITNDKEKVSKVFSWVSNLPSIPKEVSLNVDQHEYYTLVKQYGNAGQKNAVFCNLMAIAGYPASLVYNDIDAKYAKIAVKTPNETLYFDFNKDQPDLTVQEKIKCEKRLMDIIDKPLLFRNEYLRAELNMPGRAFVYYVKKMFGCHPKVVCFLLGNP